MAQWEITHSCGHSETHQIYGPVAERQGKADWLAERTCKDCYRAAQLAAANERAQELADLTGTPRQIAWALSIRDKAIAAARKDALLELIVSTLPGPRLYVSQQLQ